MDVDSPEELTQKKSVRKYATKLFKESSFSIVSSIATSGNTRRKVFRLFVFLLFTAGFLYQCIEYLCHVLTYPTVVNMERFRPEQFMAPAYTFCNYNIMKRSVFCANFPDQCKESKEKFCKKNRRYCGGNATTKVPVKNAWKILQDKEYTFELGNDVNNFLIDKTTFRENASGPYMRKSFDAFVAPCYALGQRINSDLPARYIHTYGHSRIVSRMDFLKFDAQEDQKLFTYSKSGVVFTVHNPYEAANPFVRGIFMKPGYLYQITIQKVIEESLPYPYKTDCINYTDVWFKANKTGPRSQEMCKHECLGDMIENCLNCSYQFNLYSKKLKYCTVKELKTAAKYCSTEMVFKKLETCGSKCKDECLRWKFSYDVQETYPMKSKYKGHEKESLKISVMVYLDDSETVKIKHKPEHEEEETLSYIGGLVGIWLGVSLVEIADLFESCFLISRYFCKKRTGAWPRKKQESNDIEIP